MAEDSNTDTPPPAVDAVPPSTTTATDTTPETTVPAAAAAPPPTMTEATTPPPPAAAVPASTTTTTTTPTNTGTSKKFFGGFASSADSAFKNFMTKTVTSSRNLMETTKTGSKQMIDKTGEAVTKSFEKTGQAVTKSMEKTGQAVTKSMEKTGQAVTKSVESSKQIVDKMGESSRKSVTKISESSRKSVTGFKQVVDEKVITNTKTAWEKTMETFAKVNVSSVVGGKKNTNNEDNDEAASGDAGDDDTTTTQNIANYKKDYNPTNLRCDTLDIALNELTHLIDTVNPPHIKWECQMTPFLNNSSHQDLYSSFLQWSREDILLDEDTTTTTTTTGTTAEGSGGGDAATFTITDDHDEDDDEKTEGSTTVDNGETTSPPAAAAAVATTASETDTTDATTTTTKKKIVKTKTVYNVTKAFERLESYVNWMEDHRSDLSTPTKLSVESVQAAAQAWGIECHHDEKGRFVWFLDFGKMDLPALKKEEKGGTIRLIESLRYIVYASHVMLFDKQAQEHGMVVVQSMGYKGLFESMVPLDMATKLDKFTMGTLPIKLKKIYILNSARWVGMVMGLMKPFLTTKMRQRVQVISARDPASTKVGGKDPIQRLEDELGSSCIPPTFGRIGAGNIIVPNPILEDETALAELEQEAVLASTTAVPTSFPTQTPPVPVPVPPPAE